MKLIGLTGGSGSGKTTVANLFCKFGAVVIDADEIARQVVLPGTKALRQIETVFGEAYLQKDGTLNRRQLGRLVFSDAEELHRLNEIMIPAILAEIQNQIATLKQQQIPVVVLDAPLLFDYGLDAICDVVIIMNTPLEIRLERLKKRDGLSESELKSRIASQKDFSVYENRADFLLDATDKEYLEKAIWQIVIGLGEKNACG